MTDDSYKTIPPLVAGVTDYEPWAAVVGKVRDWLRETIQNPYSLAYLTAQSAGLYTQGADVAVAAGGC